MGSDIHVHTEIKVAGVWHHFSQPRIGRAYWLFALMAGVRTSEVVPQSLFGEPRGLPEGLSFTTQLCADKWEEDGHDHSWLSGPEMARVIEEYDRLRTERAGKEGAWFSLEHERFGYLFGNGWAFDPTEEREDGDGIPACVEDVRVVFWFDC